MVDRLGMSEKMVEVAEESWLKKEGMSVWNVGR